jgi:hypothetical protein
MRAMSHQTCLAERFQSAKGLGRDFEKTGCAKQTDAMLGTLRFAQPTPLRRCLRAVR